jgi:hypothetical protein
MARLQLKATTLGHLVYINGIHVAPRTYYRFLQPFDSTDATALTLHRYTSKYALQDPQGRFARTTILGWINLITALQH